MKIKKNDQILIISGKDRGKQAKVLRVFPDDSRLVAEGINLRKKHIKPKKSGEKGQVVHVPGPFDVSNAKLVCPKCGKPARIGCKMVEKKKYRICKKCGQEI
jgi:large subunit ribosomal protein L24